MWNRKNSVAIQSYSAKANKPEPEEKKRVSNLYFTEILLTSGEKWKWCDLMLFHNAGSRNLRVRERWF